MAKFSQAMRKERIQFLIDRLNSGCDIQSRDLKIVLSADGWQDYQTEWLRQKSYRDEPKPHEITAYEKLLSKALMAYGRWDSYCQRRDAKPAVKLALELKHQAAFERAAEYLRECYDAYHGIVVWFDRSLDPNSYSIDPDGMPRVVTSRSVMNQASTPAHVMTKRQLKLDVLKTALADISQPADAVSGADTPEMSIDARIAKLKKLVKR